MHGIVPFSSLEETIAPDLKGFLGHGPVRVGNQAANQTQNDVYGSVVLAATQMFVDERLPKMGDESLFRLLETLGESALARAFEPDAGLWEYRTRSRAHTYSATLCWAACDRLAGIARRLNIADRAKYWATNARALRERILAEAWDEKRGALTGAFGAPDLDASVLLFAELGLLSATDERFVKSCDTIGRDLMRNGRIMRYTAPDDFGPPETAFLACNFWYVDALSQIGRAAEARELFESILASRNAYGLLSEDIHPDTRRAMGKSAADLLHGRHHQHRDAAVVELGGSMGPRLIIVSNRVAVPDTPRAPLAGGMAVAVKAALKNRHGMWFGWSGKVTEEPIGEPQAVEVNKITYVLIDLSKNDIQEYYNGLANSVLWPILHYRVDLQEYSRADASGYMRVNRMFADRLSPLLRDDDVIWVHDYHLMLLGRELQIARPPQHDRVFPPHALRAARHPSDAASPQGDSRRPRLLRSRRLPDRERPRQFRPLPGLARRDADPIGLTNSKARRCVSAPSRSASRPRPICVSRATPGARRWSRWCARASAATGSCSASIGSTIRKASRTGSRRSNGCSRTIPSGAAG